MSDISSFSKLDHKYAVAAYNDAKKQQGIRVSDIRKMREAYKNLQNTMHALGKHGQTPAESAKLLQKANSEKSAVIKYRDGANAATKKRDEDVRAAQSDEKLARQSVPHTNNEKKGPHGKHHGDTHGKQHSDTHGKHHGDTHGKHHGDTHGKHHGDTHGKHHGDTHGKHHGDTHGKQHGDTHGKHSYHPGNPHPHMPSKLPHGLSSSGEQTKNDKGTSLLNKKHNDTLAVDQQGTLYALNNKNNHGAFINKKGDLYTSDQKKLGNVNKDATWDKAQGFLGKTTANDLKTLATKDHGDLGKYAKDPEATEGSNKPKEHEDHKKGYQGGNPHPKLPEKLASGLTKAHNLSSGQIGINNSKHNNMVFSNDLGDVGIYNGKFGAIVEKNGNIKVTKNGGVPFTNVGNINKGDDIYKKTKGMVGETAARDLQTLVTKHHGDLGKYAQDPEAVSTPPKAKPQPPSAAKITSQVNKVNGTLSHGNGDINRIGAELEHDFENKADKNKLRADFYNYQNKVNGATWRGHHIHTQQTKVELETLDGMIP